MVIFRARTEDGRTVDDVTPETLRPLLTEERAALTMDQPEGDGRYARAVPEPSGRWQVELKAAADQPALTATLPNGDAVFDALRAWAAEDDWWREAFTWSPVAA